MTKKRYQITLTQENVEALKSCIYELDLPPSSFSRMIDSSLPGMIQIFGDLLEKRRQGKTVTLNDFYADTFSRMAELMKENQE